jgi:hypothetical protein
MQDLTVREMMGEFEADVMWERQVALEEMERW